jgi:hypothetical protein
VVIIDIFNGALAVGFEDVDGLDGVLGLTFGVDGLHTQQSVHGELREKFALSAN